MRGLYIHVPFCKSKCPYCDFYSFSSDEETKDAYTGALIACMEGYRQQDVGIDTVYFGGGTPSLLGAERVCALLDAASRNFTLAADTEITLEANPADDLREFFASAKAAGVNRISLGVQSASEEELRLLGRRHSMVQVERCIEHVRAAGIERLSLDVMLGVPNQTVQSLNGTLARLVAFSPEHISAYMLKIEEGTPYAHIISGSEHQSLFTADALPDEDLTADMYLQTCEYLEKCGYMQYEISNFAKPGEESRHNLKYWNGEEYIGIGAAAHSFFGKRRFYYPRDAAGFIAGTAPVDDGEGGSEEEYAMLRLRLCDGLRRDLWQARFGSDIPQSMFENARKFAKNGLVQVDEHSIRLTRKGFLLSNAVIAHIIFGDSLFRR